MTRTLCIALATLICTACGAHKIPGTELDDTSETRAILDVMNLYRRAVEARNAQGIIDVADESFRDDGGSSNPDDDLDYKKLFTALPRRFQYMEDVKLDLAVKKIEFDDDQRNARVTYSYTMSWRMPQLSSKTHSETDVKQMTLKRDSVKGNEIVWKITSGT